ncbi:MAG: hypothetical protein R2862_01785 [Thermoanaerobaculia bacterium]
MRQELAALVATEFRLRLRSGATWVALAAFVAGFWFWLPSADGHSVNLSWRTIDGQLQTPFLTSRLVGIACGQLCGVILGLVGFYLIAGTVKGDARRGLGPILAATPLPSWTYLAGKSLAHAAYLATLAGFGVLTGILTLAVRSDAPIEPLHLVEPAIWTALPMALLVATLAILFDVTPGLRGAGGWVAWYFLFVGLMLALPVVTTIVRETQAPAEARVARPIVWDPTGIAGLTRLVTESLPEAARGTVSSGLVVHREAPEQVEWPGVELSAAFRLQRLGTLAQALLPFALAVLFFDRFDPSRRRGKRGSPEPAIAPAGRAAERGPVAAPAGRSAGLATLPPAAPVPSTLRSIAAEIRLTFEVLGRWRWLVLALALAPRSCRGFRCVCSCCSRRRRSSPWRERARRRAARPRCSARSRGCRFRSSSGRALARPASRRSSSCPRRCASPLPPHSRRRSPSPGPRSSVASPPLAGRSPAAPSCSPCCS